MICVKSSAAVSVLGCCAWGCGKTGRRCGIASFAGVEEQVAEPRPLAGESVGV